MTDTGRIRTSLRPAIATRVFGASTPAGLDSELALITEVDLAHLVMLREARLIDAANAAAVASAIGELRARDFDPLRGRQAPRGLFLLYEAWLMDRLGARLGGVLQTARSRNDLNATVLKLRLRPSYCGLVVGALRLQALLAGRARRFSDVTMPAFTHGQAAVPITLGHHLAGVAAAVDRDVAWLLDAGTGLDLCPLGAGAAAGTSLPIDPSRTAHLLGFSRPHDNSLDAVASRDAALRLVGASASLAITVSRLAADLLFWLGSTQRFARLPDDLVGSSSLMPQKRNPFVLEHVLGATARIPAMFAAMAGSMHATQFTNSIAVGTEAMTGVADTLRSVLDACDLTRLVAASIEPQEQRMLEVARRECTTATELANRLMLVRGLSFREAHREVGRALTELEAGGEMSVELAARRLLADDGAAASGLDPASVAAASRFGGGPAPEPVLASLEALTDSRRGQEARLAEQARRWRAAPAELRRAVEALHARG